MRLAVPVVGDDVSASFGACEAVKFYEDDHGRIVHTFVVPMEGSGADAALALIERYGIDTLVCGPLAPEERRSLAMSGLLLSPGHTGGADNAARAYLGETIASDPNNTCHICG